MASESGQGMARRLARLGLRWAWMFAGMTVLALGIRLQVMAELGLGPWDVLHMGLTIQLPITFGRASQLVGLALVLAAAAIGERPRPGTLVNMWYVGQAYDTLTSLAWIPEPQGLAMRWAFLVGGVLLLAAGSAWYLSAQLGGGPRDSTMLALARLVTRKAASLPRRGPRPGPSKRPGVVPKARTAGIVRALLEGVAMACGYLLGGPVGLGTVAVVTLIGPAMAVMLPAFNFARRWWAPVPTAPLQRSGPPAAAAVPACRPGPCGGQ